MARTASHCLLCVLLVSLSGVSAGRKSEALEYVPLNSMTISALFAKPAEAPQDGPNSRSSAEKVEPSWWQNLSTAKAKSNRHDLAAQAADDSLDERASAADRERHLRGVLNQFLDQYESKSTKVPPEKLFTVLQRMADYVVAKNHRVNPAVLNKVYMRALYDPATLSSQVRIVLGEKREFVTRVVEKVFNERGYQRKQEERNEDDVISLFDRVASTEEEVSLTTPTPAQSSASTTTTTTEPTGFKIFSISNDGVRPVSNGTSSPQANKRKNVPPMRITQIIKASPNLSGDPNLLKYSQIRTASIPHEEKKQDITLKELLQQERFPSPERSRDSVRGVTSTTPPSQAVDANNELGRSTSPRPLQPQPSSAPSLLESHLGFEEVNFADFLNQRRLSESLMQSINNRTTFPPRIIYPTTQPFVDQVARLPHMKGHVGMNAVSMSSTNQREPSPPTTDDPDSNKDQRVALQPPPLSQSSMMPITSPFLVKRPPKVSAMSTTENDTRRPISPHLSPSSPPVSFGFSSVASDTDDNAQLPDRSHDIPLAVGGHHNQATRPPKRKPPHRENFLPSRPSFTIPGFLRPFSSPTATPKLQNNAPQRPSSPLLDLRPHTQVPVLPIPSKFGSSSSYHPEPQSVPLKSPPRSAAPGAGQQQDFISNLRHLLNRLESGGSASGPAQQPGVVVDPPAIRPNFPGTERPNVPQPESIVSRMASILPPPEQRTPNRPSSIQAKPLQDPFLNPLQTVLGSRGGGLRPPSVIASIFDRKLELVNQPATSEVTSTGPIDLPAQLRIHGNLLAYVNRTQANSPPASPSGAVPQARTPSRAEISPGRPASIPKETGLSWRDVHPPSQPKTRPAAPTDVGQLQKQNKILLDLLQGALSTAMQEGGGAGTPSRQRVAYPLKTYRRVPDQDSTRNLYDAMPNQGLFASEPIILPLRTQG